jgi:hypothetical protein
MSTTKISVTIEDTALEWLRDRAKRLHGGNLSAAIAEAALVSRKQEALRAFLDEHDVPALSPSELDEIVSEWAPKTKAPTRRRPSRSKSKR